MSDENQVIECPSCGHQNAPYVDKCIICDFSLVLYRKQLNARNTPEGRALENDSSIGPANKRLGPLPDSDHLVDKHKSKGDTAQVLHCHDCGEANRVGAFMCHNCGARLTESKVLPRPVEVPAVEEETRDAHPVYQQEEETQSVNEFDDPSHHPREQPALIIPQLLDETARLIPDSCFKFTPWMILRFDVVGFETPIVIHPIEDKPLLIGRRHDSLPVQPHIDLTSYLVGKHGVSRRHALLRLRGTRLELQDLDSTNGTSINGVRFSPKESHQVRHQDLIMIGQVQLQVSFVKRVRSAAHGHTEELS